MRKQITFITGMPRSGTTLLSSILNQNPNIYATPNSALCSIMWGTQSSIYESEQFMGYPNIPGANALLNTVAQSYYSENKEEFIMDKCRNWGLPDNIAMIEKHITKNPKFVIVVRDVLEVLASFITIVNSSKNKNNFIDNNLFVSHKSIDDTRCDYLMQTNGLIDRCLWSIKSILASGHQFHLITYDDITDKKEETIKKLYEFLEIPFYDHDFNNIINKHPEDDNIFGLDGFHSVRKKVGKISKPVNEVLSDYIIKKYGNENVW
jgi:sulfotransferase